MSSSPSARGRSSGGLARVFRWLSQPRRPGAATQTVLDEVPWHVFDRLQLVTPTRVGSGVGGEHRSRVRAPSPDFADYRPYQHGDDFRRIDWNVYGRLGTLQVRLSEAHERTHLRLLLDCSASMRWGDPEKQTFAARLGLALARLALARGDAVTVHCLGAEQSTFGPVSGISRFPEIQSRLSAPPRAARVNLENAVRDAFARRAGVRGSRPLLVLVSDLHHVDDPVALFELLVAHSPSPVVLHVISPEEAEPEAIGDVDIVDSETGEVIEVGLSVETVTRYRDRFQAWRQGMEQSCLERQIRYVTCAPNRPLQELVLGELRAHKVVR